MNETIIPQPRHMQRTGGTWSLTHRGHWSADVRIIIGADEPDALAPQIALATSHLRDEQMFRVEQGPIGEAHLVLLLNMTPRSLAPAATDAGLVDERHRLTVTPQRITIEAATPQGIAMGIQTLRQLLSGQRARLEIPCMIIEDEPAMSWRGLHLDVSRHFFSAVDVMRYIDLAAYHKLNIFHWHLTDDQGWRLPIEGYPRLTEVAAWREQTMIGHDCDRASNPRDGVRHGGSYTHEEIRSIVQFAAARGVHVLPEIDVPGHVQALVTAYPQFGNNPDPPGVRDCWGISDNTLNLEDQTFRFLDDMLAATADLFPFSYVHLGGDEARTVEWARSERIHARMRELGIAAVENIQGYFTAHLAKQLARHGRRMIGWDEIIEHDDPPVDTAVMYWRDSQTPDPRLDLKALRSGRPLVLANWSRTYFDLYQSAGPDKDVEPLAICGNLPLEKVYQWQPLERIDEHLRQGVLGAQAQLWTEYIPNRHHLEYMAYPRACALAQVAWTGDDREPWDAFTQRLARHLVRLDRLGVRYRPL